MCFLYPVYLGPSLSIFLLAASVLGGVHAPFLSLACFNYPSLSSFLFQFLFHSVAGSPSRLGVRVLSMDGHASCL